MSESQGQTPAQKMIGDFAPKLVSLTDDVLFGDVWERKELAPRDRYKVLTAFVLPRPIAWVTTIGPTGVVNAAPFSFFNVFSEAPPLLVLGIEGNKRGDGKPYKDTVRNISERKEFGHQRQEVG